jgi:type I restriction enzyme, R subunit
LRISPEHYADKIEPNGFKAQVVAFDPEACVLYKEALDKIMASEASEVVMSLGQGDPADWKKRFMRPRDEEEKLLDRFRDPLDPLKILIVTSRSHWLRRPDTAGDVSRQANA